jgi:hypothetical protein
MVVGNVSIHAGKPQNIIVATEFRNGNKVRIFPYKS